MTAQAFDYKFLLLENYKKLNLSEDELAVILMTEHLINLGNRLITADILSLKMSLDSKKIDQILANLFTRGFIEFAKVGKHTSTSLEPLYAKLRREFEVSLTKEEANKNNQQVHDDIKCVIDCFEKEFGRSISPVESSKMSDWIMNQTFKASSIVDAIKDCSSKGKKSIRSIEKLLLTWASRDDIDSEGQTSISDNWNKNLEETIRIAKTPWLDKKDE